MSPDFDGALTEEEVRREVAEARRIVIKVGSSSLSSESHGLNTDRVAALVRTLADCHDEGHDVVLVSSGAIAAGLSPLGLRLRPAVGQRHGVDGARAGAADPGGPQPAVHQQGVQHAPGEGAVRAAALQRKVNDFRGLGGGVTHGSSGPHASRKT